MNVTAFCMEMMPGSCIAAAIDAGKLVCNMKILVCKLTHHTIIRGAVSNSPFWSAVGCNYMQQADMHVQDH